MNILTRRDSTSGSGRVQAFSDGVFAIIITLLVLDLHVPEHRAGELGATLASHWPSYVAFAASFLYVGALWLNHHALFRRVARVDLPFQWLNLSLLFGTVIIPFPTALVASTFDEETSDTNDQRIAVLVYSLLAAFMSLMWLGVWTYLSRHTELLAAGTSQRWPQNQIPRPVTGIVLFILGGLAAWFISPTVGLVAILAMIVYHTFTSEGIGRSRHPASATDD